MGVKQQTKSSSVIIGKVTIPQVKKCVIADPSPTIASSTNKKPILRA